MEYPAENKLTLLRQYLKTSNLDGFVIPSNDFYQNEYCPPHLNILNSITGFTGSNGVCIVTLDKAILFTDSRYLLQAKAELSSEIEILDMNAPLSCSWFATAFTNDDAKLGYDPNLHAVANIKYYETLEKKYKFKMVPIKKFINHFKPDVVELIKPAYHLNLKYAGVFRYNKISSIVESMNNAAQHLLITDPASVCWLLNIRGHDLEYTPIVLCTAILSKVELNSQTLETYPGSTRPFFHQQDTTLGPFIVHLFVNKQKVNFNLPNLMIYAEEELDNVLHNITAAKQIIQLDTKKIPQSMFSIVADNYIDCPDPIQIFKAQKNATEKRNLIPVHLQDGLVVTKLLHWIHTSVDSITELDVVAKLLELRKHSKDFVFPSFATIAAYANNAAIIHYKPNTKTNQIIGYDNFLLIDSGGQYLGGTTDVTRTILLGEPNEEQKRFYTLVLKSHISLAQAKFDKNTIGSQLDSIARSVLQQQDLDYGHGTGHGVGSFLSVHESPPSISKTSNSKFVSGMVLSNEPGYYEQNFGIRLENLMLVKAGKVKGALEFSTLTLVPFQYNLIDYNLLNKAQIRWLKTYQLKIIKQFTKYLSESELSWLKRYVGIKC